MTTNDTDARSGAQDDKSADDDSIVLWGVLGPEGLLAAQDIPIHVPILSLDATAMQAVANVYLTVKGDARYRPVRVRLTIEADDSE